jgi:class 3 adenylate cyclase
MGQDPEQKAKVSHRSLRAVFAADIIDSTGARSADKPDAGDAFNGVLSIVDQHLQKYGGGLFETPGEAVFALFESAVNAVRCALETQGQLALRGETGDRHLRIGIHLGEVIFENGLARGEAITVAAGLEALADPGGILVSGAVMDAVSSRISATFEERGVPRLENIPRRIVTFAVTPPPARTNADDTRAGISILDHTTQLDLDTLRSLRGAQKSDEAVIAQLGAANGIIAPASQKTEPVAKDPAPLQAPPDSSAKAYPSPAAAQPAEDAGKRIRQEPPSPQPSRTAKPFASTASTPDKELGSPARAPGQGPSPECVKSLADALSVHLGPSAKALVNRYLPDATSNEHLVGLLEKQIKSNTERFQFRLSAAHICKAFSNRQSDEA